MGSRLEALAELAVALVESVLLVVAGVALAALEHAAAAELAVRIVGRVDALHWSEVN